MEAISLWHCFLMQQYSLQLVCIVGSTLSHLSLEKRIKHSNILVSTWEWFWQCGQVPSPAGKVNQHLHKACQQKKAWSAPKSPDRWLHWLWTSENTVDQHQQTSLHPQIITDCGNFTLDFNQHGFCLSTLPPDSGTLISKWNAKFKLIWKEDFGPLSNSPVIFLLSPGKMLLTMFVCQKWLGSLFPVDVWAWWLLMHWLQLQFTPCEALPSVWISFT